jgi:CRAL/TRIO domain/CRAL/TRIO, N-terminal domain
MWEDVRKRKSRLQSGPTKDDSGRCLTAASKGSFPTSLRIHVILDVELLSRRPYLQPSIPSPPRSACIVSHHLDMATVETPIQNVTITSEMEKTTAAMDDIKLADEPQSEQQTVLPSSTTMKLPHTGKDGLIKTPLDAPLETSKPAVRPPLTPDQEQKYQGLLANVLKWTDIPTASTKDAKKSPLTDTERMFMTRDCILRYLRASTWNLATAEKRIENTLVWRREYGVESHTPDYISVENETGKQLIIGWDIEGRPCQYMRPSKQNTPRGDRQIQHLVFMLERSIDMMPPGQETLALLINFAETKSGQGATIGQGKQTLNILQNHYPERLGRALVTNVPLVIWGFFKLITPFIDPLTRQKIKFNEDMGLHVPRAQLLKESQGEVEFEYEHAIYWKALNELCALKRAEYTARWEKGGSRIGENELYLRGGDAKSVSETEEMAKASKVEPEPVKEETVQEQPAATA